MNNQVIIKNSFKIFLVCLFLVSIVSFFKSSINLVLGFILGYILNLINYKMVNIEVNAILDTNSKMAGRVAFIMFVGKYLVHALVFFIAVKLPAIFSIFTTLLGCFMIKLSIFYSEYRVRKG